MAVIIQLRRDTATNWALNNPILAEGEKGIEIDTNKEKTGDGTSEWNSLTYFGTSVEGHIIADSDEQFAQQPVLKFIGAVSITNGTGETVVEIITQPITVDNTPTDGSNNPVSSNGVFDALANKVNISDQTAANIIVDATGFNGNLAPTDTNQQLVNQKFDDLVLVDSTPTLITPFTPSIAFDKKETYSVNYSQSGTINFTLANVLFGYGSSFFITINTNGDSINFTSDFIILRNDYSLLTSGTYDFMFLLGADGKVRVSIVNHIQDIINPTILSVNIAGLNMYVDLSLSEGGYGAADGITSLQAASFKIIDFVAAGATALAIGSITKTNAQPLAGGETIVRLNLSITGSPTGVETFKIAPFDGSSVFDRAGNRMAATQNSGTITLFSGINYLTFVTAGNIVNFTKSGNTYTATTNGYTSKLLADQFITGDSYVKIDSMATGDDVLMGFRTDNVNGAIATWSHWIGKIGSLYYWGALGVGATSTGISWVAGDAMRIRRFGGLVIGEYYRGGSWFTAKTFGATYPISGTNYIQFSCDGTGDRVINPQIV